MVFGGCIHKSGPTREWWAVRTIRWPTLYYYEPTHCYIEFIKLTESKTPLDCVIIYKKVIYHSQN